MIIGAVIFLIAYLLLAIVDKCHSIMESRINDYDAFVKNFDKSLDDLERLGIVTFYTKHTKCLFWSVVCRNLFLLCLCLKVVSLALEMLTKM